MKRARSQEALERWANGPRLGTFLGVYTPSILTILGVVLFLRTGWVVGNVGLMPAVALVVLAHLITASTALSVSAVATNMHVRTGGAYYMISRSLGLEIGGAIGVPLFLAQTFSVTLYAFGLAEVLQIFWPDLPQQPVAAATVVGVSLLSLRGPEFALRLQLPIMVGIGLALGSLWLGAARDPLDTVALWSGVDDAVPFWVVFAIFFPAVTGIMAGISLSGDLADPGRSIPRGTLAAVATGFVVYVAVVLGFGLAAEPQELVGDSLIWISVSLVGWLVFPGLFGAIFSSAVGSILGAPRTFAALVEDGVIPGAPRRWLRSWKGIDLPLLLSATTALAAVSLGNLNAVAPVLTMFFLTTYGVINLVAGLEQLSGAPFYRPSLKVPWIISLAGAVGCVWVMFLIQPLAAVLAIVVELAIYFGMRRRALAASWGDMRYGALMSLARATLLRLRELPVDPRNWRPHILVFAADPQKEIDLIRFSSWLNQKRGILTVCQLEIGQLAEHADALGERAHHIDECLAAEGIVAFSEVDVANDFRQGVLSISQANGIAGLHSNTVMFGWAEDPRLMAANISLVEKLSILGKSTIVCRIAPRRWTSRLRRIDVWWGGLQSNGDMLLLFAHLVSMNPEWAGARIVVKSIATSEMTYEQSTSGLSLLLDRARIEAETKVFRRPQGETIQQIIQRESRDADVVFMGLREPRPGDEAAYIARVGELIGDLPTVVLVRAAGPFAGELI